jgi:hypothetical protein
MRPMFGHRATYSRCNDFLVEIQDLSQFSERDRYA